jgi:hypothetical protein
VILLVAGGTRLPEAPFEELAKWLYHPVLRRFGEALWLERCRLAGEGVSAWLDAGLRRSLDRAQQVGEPTIPGRLGR